MAAPELVERAKARIGNVLRDKWRLDSLLGVGGSAAVYAATHRNGKRGAIKLLHPELSVQTDFVTRFLREGYVANKINHPGAVSILDDDHTEDGTAFLVMELLEGYTLERRLRKQSAFPVGDALKIVEELLDIVSAAHDQGIIHRDLKPANIFVTKKQEVKVLDFGIARLGEAHHLSGSTQMGMPLGTPAFMPPEQARGRWGEVDVRTDLWAVGATLWALLSGQRPRRAETANEELLLAMTEPLAPIGSTAPHVSLEVCKLVDRAVAFDMSARWPNAKTMQQALRLALLLEHAHTSTPGIVHPSVPPVTSEAKPRTQTAVGVPPMGVVLSSSEGKPSTGGTISGLGGYALLPEVTAAAASLEPAPAAAEPNASQAAPEAPASTTTVRPFASLMTGRTEDSQITSLEGPPSLNFSGALSLSRYDALGERRVRPGGVNPTPTGETRLLTTETPLMTGGARAMLASEAEAEANGSPRRSGFLVSALLVGAVAVAAFFAYQSGWLGSKPAPANAAIPAPSAPASEAPPAASSAPAPEPTPAPAPLVDTPDATAAAEPSASASAGDPTPPPPVRLKPKPRAPAKPKAPAAEGSAAPTPSAAPLPATGLTDGPTPMIPKFEEPETN